MIASPYNVEFKKPSKSLAVPLQLQENGITACQLCIPVAVAEPKAIATGKGTPTTVAPAVIMEAAPIANQLIPLGILILVVAYFCEFCFEVATICTSPFDLAVTRPSLSTVATWSLLEDQYAPP